MAYHDVTKQIEKLIAQGASIESLVKKYSLFEHNGEFFTCNRRLEAQINSATTATATYPVKTQNRGRMSDDEIAYLVGKSLGVNGQIWDEEEIENYKNYKW
jgi:hypothetical protein